MPGDGGDDRLDHCVSSERTRTSLKGSRTFLGLAYGIFQGNSNSFSNSLGCIFSNCSLQYHIRKQGNGIPVKELGQGVVSAQRGELCSSEKGWTGSTHSNLDRNEKHSTEGKR